ncbi:MAG: pyrroline-5-carboxylate reductase family protein [Tsuneonella sp.]
MPFEKFLFVGCGNMGGAMLDGWLAAGVAPETFTVMDPHREQVPPGVTLVREVPPRAFDAVLLGIKPQLLAGLASEIRRAVGPATTVFSVLAGVELATLARHVPGAAARVRVMPNLAAQLGKSPIALVGDGLDERGRAEVQSFMAKLGQVEWLPGEDMFDLVTALAGSGPAFVYRFIDALASGAAELGLPRVQAERLAVAMVEGAAALAAASPHSPAELARRVAIPGGVTQVGLDILDRDDALARLVHDTLRGARHRSAEMAAEARAKG